jgi:glyoxylase I family protein
MLKIRAIDHLVLRVRDIDAMRRFGAEGNGVSIYVTDPEGNVIELKGPSDGALRPPA